MIFGTFNVSKNLENASEFSVLYFITTVTIILSIIWGGVAGL